MTAAPAAPPTPLPRVSRPTRRHPGRPLVAPRVYRRRRALVGGVSAVAVAGVLMLGAEALGGGRPAGAASGGVASGGSVVARPGDTLWSIAGEHRGPVPIGRYVDALVDLNGGASIQAGETVQLP